MSVRIEFGFIPFPLSIVDKNIDLSLGEYRLLGYLLRHRFRVKTEKMQLTHDELLKGSFKPDGSRRDKGCGITSPRDLKKARETLVERGWLVVYEQAAGMIYEVNLHTEDDSAKCTEEDSAKSSSKECILSEITVQNALNDNKELRRFKKIEENTLQTLPLATLSVEILKPSEPSKKESDPRWNIFLKDLKTYWDHKNVGIPMPWAGAIDGKAVKLFLSDNPNVERLLWQKCLSNRGKSDVSHGDHIHRWIRQLLRYHEGPRDRFDKLTTSNGNSQKQIEEDKKYNDTNNNFAQTDAIFGLNKRSTEVRTPQVVSGEVRPLLESSTDYSGINLGMVRRDPAVYDQGDRRWNEEVFQE